MNLNECRDKIDDIDAKLLDLFTQRMDVVREIANYKKDNNLPILNKQREAAVIENKISNSPDDIKNYVKAFFTNLMEVSKCLQINMLDTTENSYEEESSDKIFKTISSLPETKVVCQGALGAYQHTMAKKLFPKSQLDFCDSYDAVFDAVKSGAADYGVVPLENSTAGTVNDVYDLLSRSELYIVGMEKLKIDHCLAAKSGCNFPPKQVFSYIQALNQCSDFLKLHPLISVCESKNTALAAKFVANNDSIDIGAICSEDCANIYGLQILQSGIQNRTDNYTRFIVIAKDRLNSPDFDEISICVKIPNLQGELTKLVTKFSLYSFDMTKLESRPLGGEDFSVLFYISFRANILDPNVTALIHDLKYNYEFFKLLGCYKNV